jgi:hypothetical protein
MSSDSLGLMERQPPAGQSSRCQRPEPGGKGPLNWIDQAITQTRDLIADSAFCHRHRRNDKAFTRRRCFTFVNSMLFLMQKTVRAIQTHVQSFFEALGQPSSGPTVSAWSQARKKLRYTAFIDLNEQAVLQVVYADRVHPKLRLWRGYRLCAIDSSLQRLPKEEKLGQEFGWVECSNQNGEAGRYPEARLSAMTDVLNRIAIHTLLEPSSKGEREQAREHVQQLQPEDLALLDRGYAEYYLWACFAKANRRFVCRCQNNTFAIVNRLFQENQEGRSVTVDLHPHRELVKELEEAGLPMVLRLRFVTVRLSTGELEVLATNLLEEDLYPTECFQELYHCRWGVETYYEVLKSRLDLGNFTGLTPEAIRQDVYSTVFVSNLESILIGPANEQLKEHSATLKHEQQVNHAVSFHAIKSHIIALLASHKPLPEVVEKLQQLFLANPTAKRPERKVARKKPSAWRSYYHQRCVRKVVF